MDFPNFANARHDLGSATVGMASHGDDKGLFVEFSTRPTLMPFKSQEAGRPIYEDKAFITIDFPGDKTKRVDRQVKLENDDCGPSDMVRFPRQWQMFLNQQEQNGDGMPITEWPPITRSQALELKAIKIHTVEMLAELPDSSCTWLGSRELRQKARTWLENVSDHSAESRLQAALDQRDATIEALRLQVTDLAARLDGADAASSKSSAAQAAPAKSASRRAAAIQEN
jgi:hypothetical protein